MTNGRLVRVQAAVAATGTTGRLVRVTAATAAPSGTTGKVVRITASLPASLEVVASDQTGKKPYETVTIAASAVGGTATGWSFSSPGITFSGTGATRTFTAPATRFGTVVPVTITATGSGVQPGSAIVTVAVLPHGEFKNVSGVETPVRWTRRTP